MPERNWLAREQILRRLREAVGRLPATPGTVAPPNLPVAEGLEAFAARFRHTLTVGGAEHGSYRLVQGAAEARGALAALLARGAARSWVVWPTELCERIASELPNGRAAPRPGSPPDAAIVEAELLCAETGALALRSGPGRARSDALLPPVQIVLARAERLVGGLDEVLAATAAWGAAQVVWVAGPSRTADVEKTLVVPAHGPRELHLIVVEG